jgi:hypothetical protein
MNKAIWKLHVECKESGVERYIQSFDTRQDAMQFIAVARKNLALVFGEPINCWLYQYEAQLTDRVRVSGGEQHD